MLEKPNLDDKLLKSSLQEAYGLPITAVDFLPLGADTSAATYRVTTMDQSYFLKLRKVFDEHSLTLPVFLHAHGMQEIIAPLVTTTNHHWTNVADFTAVLYPFVDGNNGFVAPLTNSHKRQFGRAVCLLHETKNIFTTIPQENFAPDFRTRLRELLAANATHHDAIVKKLLRFMTSKRQEIENLVDNAEALATIVSKKDLPHVLTHTDLHGGNLLINGDKLYIVDWDAPLYAPKERDLMFIGAGIDDIWPTSDDEKLFYEGYGPTKIDHDALAYYRLERIITDLVDNCTHAVSPTTSTTDREQTYAYFTTNFQPNNTLARALAREHKKSPPSTRMSFLFGT